MPSKTSAQAVKGIQEIAGELLAYDGGHIIATVRNKAGRDVHVLDLTGWIKGTHVYLFVCLGCGGLAQDLWDTPHIAGQAAETHAKDCRIRR